MMNRMFFSAADAKLAVRRTTQVAKATTARNGYIFGFPKLLISCNFAQCIELRRRLLKRTENRRLRAERVNQSSRKKLSPTPSNTQPPIRIVENSRP